MAYVGLEISKSANGVGKALELITKRKNGIIVYSVSENGKIVNINDFQERTPPPLPKKSQSATLTYRYNKSHYLVKYLKDKSSNDLLLMFDYQNYNTVKAPIMLQMIVVLLFTLLYLLIFFQDKVYSSDRNYQEIIGRVRLQDSFAHELKTPLTAIQGYIDLIATSTEVNEAQQYAKKTQGSIERLSNSIEQVLSISLLGDFKEGNDIYRDSSEVISKALKNFLESHPNRKINLMILESKRIKNTQALTLILNNIFSNYAKHTTKKAIMNITTSLKENKLEILIGQEMVSKKVGAEKKGGIGLAIVNYLKVKYNIEVEHDEEFNYKITL